MELVRGESLKNVLARRGKLDEQTVAAWWPVCGLNLCKQRRGAAARDIE